LQLPVFFNHRQPLSFTARLLFYNYFLLKTNNMKKLLSGLTAILLCTTIWSCSKDDDKPAVQTKFDFKAATISGANEVPANTSTATGTATGTYDSVTKILTINVTFSGFTATAAHVHKAAAGTNGGVVFNFAPQLTSPIVYTSPALTAAQEADLFANLYYVNIHSAAFPSGEIRGQLIKQ
jgi:hypothetical protein